MATKFCEIRRPIRPPVYNVKRPYEYFSDLSGFTRKASDGSQDVRLEKLLQLVKKLNEKVGVEDLTMEKENQQADTSDVVFENHAYQKNVSVTNDCARVCRNEYIR